MITYLKLLPLNLFLTVFNYMFAWLIAFFVRDDYTLRKPFKLFQTTDALMNGRGTVPGGGGGDDGFFRRWYDRESRCHTPLSKAVNRWYTSMLWLIRNPINGFDEGYFGRRCFGVIRLSGDADMDHFKGKSILRRLLRDRRIGDRCFELYLKIKWPFINRYFRLRMGWKIEEIYTGEMAKDTKAQFVFAPTIFKPLREDQR